MDDECIFFHSFIQQILTEHLSDAGQAGTVIKVTDESHSASL